MNELDFIEVDEKSRTYVWPDGHRDVIENVVRVCVRDSGTHRIETSDGKKHIVRIGWIRIEIDVEKWSF